MSSNGKQSVTVIGLGPMGRAMAAAFLDRGYAVTLWNRTASRADELVARGAVLAPGVAEALAANEVVVLSLTDYAAMYAVLEPAEAALPGRVLVNLSSDTPERARTAARWAAERGAVHLTGGVTVRPPGSGSRSRPSSTAARARRSTRTGPCSRSSPAAPTTRARTRDGPRCSTRSAW